MFAGKMIKATSNVIGTVSEKGISGSGKIISKIARKKNHNKLAKSTEVITSCLGKAVNIKTRVAGAVVGKLVDKTIEAGIKSGKNLGKKAIKKETKIYGDSENFYDRNKYVNAKYTVK